MRDSRASMKYVTDSYDPQTGRVTEQNTQADTAKTSVDDLHYRYWHHHPQKPAPVTTSRTYNSGPSQASCGTSTGQCISPHGGHGVFSWLKKGGTWTLGLLSGFTSLAGAGLSAAEAAELAGLASAGGWMSQAEYDALVGTGVMQGLEEGEAAACGESFTASTKVLLGPGAAVPISALKPGDKVLATNVKTGKTQPETVAAVLVHHDTDLYNLKVKSGHRTTAPPHHRHPHHRQPPVLGRFTASVDCCGQSWLLSCGSSWTRPCGPRRGTRGTRPCRRVPMT
jgi:hypothetical protein